MAPSGGASSNTIKVMGITPEKHLLHSEVLSGLHSQFHSQASQSPQSLETTAIRAPGSLGPLPLSSPSSLSRTQFLVAAQAATLPCFPSSCSSDGGVVLDRVLVQGGKGEHLWAALTGRAKAQRITTKRRHHGWKRALADPESYTLCANARLRARPGSCLKLSAELQPRNASEEVQQQQASQADLGQSIAGVLRRSTVRASSQLQHRLRHAELRAGVAYNQRLQHCKGYSTVPLTSSIDLCTPHQLSTPLQFRAGLYHATAPAELNAGEDSPGPLRSSVHMQGGLALQGERNLWSGNPAARRVKLYKQQQQRQQQQQQQQQRRPYGTSTSGSAPTSASSHATSTSPSLAPAGAAATAAAASPPMASHSSNVGAPAHVASASGNSSHHHSSGREGARPRSNTLGPHNPIRQYLQRLLPQGHHAGSGFGEEEEEGEEQQKGRGQGGWGPSGASGWLAPDADQVQESVIDATQSTSRLREDVQSLTDWVTSGAFSEQLQRRVGTAPSRGKAPRFESSPCRTSSTCSSSSSENQPPWSSLLGPPHFRIAGMFGASMLAPLGPLQGSKGSTRLVGGAAGEGASAASVPHQPLQPSLESLKGGISHLAKQEVAVRPFASAGASLQLGWFQRPALDYTRLVAKLDLGVPGSAQQAAGSSNMHPAFGLEQRGVWHALTLSLRQQLMGPLRFCADLRYSLDSKQPWNNTPALATPPPPPTSTGPIPHPGQQSIPTKARRGNRATEGACNLARHVGGMRPSLLESTYGLDLVLPGMSGFGRLVAWYAPGRKEGMLELRLF